MSIANDFGMYYSDTYVGIREKEDIIPFYIREVRFQRSVRPGTENNLSHINNLLFVGNRLTKRKDGSYVYQDNSESIPIENLILDVPLLGYYELQGVSSERWIYHLPQRSTKKGFTYRKTNIGEIIRTNSQGFLKLIWDIFNDTRSYNSRNFFLDKNNNLFYKGLHIGTTVPEKGVSLKKSAKYLESMANAFLSEG